MNNLDVLSIRKKLNLTQEEFARKIGVTRVTVINYEKGGVIPDSKKEIIQQLQLDGVQGAEILDLKKLREDRGYTQTELANMIGVSLRTMQNYEDGGKIKDDKAILLKNILVDGEEMSTLVPQNTKAQGVPYFEDIESSGGIVVEKASYGKEIPSFFIDYEHFNDCTAYIQHVGDSMYPKYCSGEIIAIKRVFNFNVILWGEAYLVVTNDNANNLRTVKLMFQHEDDRKIILRSSNPNFKGDTIIDKIDIISLFIVKGKITRNQL